MATFTADKFVIPDGAVVGTTQKMQSSEYGEDDLRRASKDLGWANYVDTEWTDPDDAGGTQNPLQLNSGNSYTAILSNNALGSGTNISQWPSGQTEPWDTATDKMVAVTDGDLYTLRVDFEARDGATAALLDFYIDIGGAVGEIVRRSISIQKGASVSTHVSLTTTIFTGSTFVANGGTFYVSSASTGSNLDIWDVRFLIERSYKAR